jgi:hypothetical protein
VTPWWWLRCLAETCRCTKNNCAAAGGNKQLMYTPPTLGVCTVLCISYTLFQHLVGVTANNFGHGLPAARSVRKCKQESSERQAKCGQQTSAPRGTNPRTARGTPRILTQSPPPTKRRQVLLRSAQQSLVICFARYDVIPVRWLPLLSR